MRRDRGIVPQWVRHALGSATLKAWMRAAVAVQPAIALLFGALWLPVWAKGSAPENEARRTDEAVVAALVARWGVKLEGTRLSAAGYIVDFRYRIIDPDKAMALVDRRLDPYLIDEASGKRLVVPSPAKLGPLRQTTKYGPPKQGRVYFVLFANPGRIVRRGDRVTVAIGDFRAADLVVE